MPYSLPSLSFPRTRSNDPVLTSKVLIISEKILYPIPHSRKTPLPSTLQRKPESTGRQLPHFISIQQTPVPSYTWACSSPVPPLELGSSAHIPSQEASPWITRKFSPLYFQIPSYVDPSGRLFPYRFVKMPVLKRKEHVSTLHICTHSHG